ncbi:MAG: D-alanyl-D-alanine carboxypeptidase/D-alanyl-D-alanine-endopeptidase, partial [Deltaproteobacteria bacterium]|nr:D-alanyl-D-alanine carboxypeptidase/D-alanyl-D-alanine-endopeptidase [Deltaproteobacteria bacterium]
MNSRVVKVSLVPKSRSLRRLLALVLVSVSISAHAGQAEDRALLKARLEGLLSQPPLAGSHVSGEVVSLEDGAQLWSRTPNDELNPASNTKVVTAAVALLKLGPEYRFTTELLADGGVGKNGRIKALYLRGKADPTLDTERLQSFASDLWHRGVRQVQDLVLDDSFLDDQPWGPGWDTEDSDKPYAAPVGALSVNHNSVGIWVVPGDRPGKARIELDPEAKGFFVLDNRVQTVRAGNRKHLVPHTMDGGNDRTRVVVAGRVAVGDPQVFWRRVTDPAFYTGYVLKQALIERGIKVTGKVKRGVTPASATSITIFESHALGEIVREMNKVSSNFQAEMILKTLGAEVKGAPGTWAKGVEAAEGILADLGLAKGTYTLKNGSGLNDTNRFSAHQITTLLAAMWKKFHVSAEFVASLSVAGRDGTLRQRMEGTDAAGRLRAKTGTLDKVTALSGYLQSVGGERMVFSLLVNDWAGRSGPVVTAVDRFGALMASTGAVDPLLAQADLPPPELKARLASYAAMAASPDPKNAPILRAEIAIVKDPLLKAAAADALYRTAPGEGGGAALLDVLPPGPELYVRLRAMGRELLLPLPLVSTLLDLGADGSADALARLLALAPLALGPNAEPELAQALSEGLADVSDAAPEEMKAALLAAPELQSKAAITLIAQGLAVANFDTARSA